MDLFFEPESFDEKFALPEAVKARCGGNNQADIMNFSDMDAGAFHFDQVYFRSLSPVTSTASAMATAMMKSTRWLNVFVNICMRIHKTEADAISDRKAVHDRILKLIDTGFFVTVDCHRTYKSSVRSEPLAYILRTKGKRMIYLDESFVSHVSTHSLRPNATSTTEQQHMTLIAVLALLVAHEASHWLHTMVNPAYFYKDSNSGMCVEKNISPAKLMHLATHPGVYFPDFGRIVETAYYGGSITIGEMIDDLSGLPAMYAVEHAQIRIPLDQLRSVKGCEVRVAITAHLFRKDSYLSNSGITFPEVVARKEELVVEASIKAEQRRKVAAAKRPMEPAVRSNPPRKKLCGGQPGPQENTAAGGTGDVTGDGTGDGTDANTSTAAADAGTCSGTLASQRRSRLYDNTHSNMDDYTDDDSLHLSHPMQHMGEDSDDDETAGRPTLSALRSDGTVAGNLGTATV